MVFTDLLSDGMENGMKFIFFLSPFRAVAKKKKGAIPAKIWCKCWWDRVSRKDEEVRMGTRRDLLRRESSCASMGSVGIRAGRGAGVNPARTIVCFLGILWRRY